MSLSKKTILIIGLTFACLIILLFSTAKYIMLNDYADLEKLDTRQNTLRVLSAIDEKVDEVTSINLDWARWDDSYEFIQNGNIEYIETNILDTTFENIRLNTIVFINNSGEIVFGENYDLINKTLMPLPDESKNTLVENTGLWQHDTEECGHSGIYMFEEGPMILASEPILTSDGKGPVMGTLIMGRYLNDEEIAGLAESTHLSLAIDSFDGPEVSGEIKTSLAGMEDDSPVFVQPLNNDTIIGYGLIRDLFGNPVLVAKVELERAIYQQGISSLRILIMALAAFVLIFGALIVFLLEKKVLSRLKNMIINFGLISSSSDHSMRLELSGNDELAQLADSANKMLESLQQTHQNLSDSKERYRTLTENTYDLISEINTDGLYLYTSPNYSEVLGYESSDMVNKSIGDFICEEDKNKVLDAVISLEPVALKEHTYRIKCKDGNIKWFESTGKTYSTVNGEVRLVFVSRDISDRRRYEETIKFQAFHDSLTHLPNRSLFKDRLSLALAHSKRNKKMLALIFLDLDRFKMINDTLGHEVGDQLLCEVAARLKESLREDDTVARQGGDEFTIMLPDIASEDGAAKVAEKILESIRRPFIIRDHELFISTSAGIALYPNDGEDSEALLKNADTAMYLSKDKNRDNYQFYTPALNQKTQERLLLENELRRAIDRKEFVLHYQPKVNTITGELTGVEALVRWLHPERGLLLPEEFIPIAEETGIIMPMGEWVLRTACSQNKSWQTDGYTPLCVSVNLSGRQFLLQNLAEMIKRILNETGLDPHWLELEITESTAMLNSEYTIETLYRLKKMGIQLSIDDFGTGYSSLSQLKRFPVDKLKIDKTFVMEIGETRDSEVIASTVIALCKSLKLGVIAEGVETEEQYKFLQKHQCSEMQGYLFSQPLTAIDLEAVLAGRKLSKSS